jgi:hypothetical protein
MTTETQTFINISDIKGIRAECAECKVRIVVPLSTKETQVQAQKLAKNFRCPVCGAEWFKGADDPRLTVVGNFIGYLLDMRSVEPDFAKGGVKLNITLEINSSTGAVGA